MSAMQKSRVYRVRNLPNHVDRHAAVQLLAECLQTSLENIHLESLVNALDPWQHDTSQTATLTFTQDISSSWNGKVAGIDEWCIPVAGLPSRLILDAHFDGFTPLNEPDPSVHSYDCIALFGLASHPFGSWQTHGNDKSFMWIRDALSKSLHTFRFFTYGYDTTIVNSKSFQSIPDLAGRLISAMKANGWASPSAKRIVFLSHSLGGVILKQMLVMLAHSGESEAFILDQIKGALFFGVPSKGMDVSHLLAMTQGQPNQELIDDLAIGSPYLSNLSRQFEGVSQYRRMRFFWAYETKQSPTVKKNEVDGSWSRSGPLVILVSKDSATNGLHLANPTSTFQIDEDHSNMVKFSQGDNRTVIVTQNLMEIAGIQPATAKQTTIIQKAAARITRTIDQGDTALKDWNRFKYSQLLESVIKDAFTNEVILKSLRAPERDWLLEQIDPAHSYTFEWVFDDNGIGFTDWLRKGEGIFWVSGKPGSGKSTMMKLLNNDPRTAELIQHWGSDYKQLHISFFFHHRGTLIQKSFEGLLRSIISQIIEKVPSMVIVIRQMALDEYNDRIGAEMLGDLFSDLLQIFDTLNLTFDQMADRQMRSILKSLDIRAQFLEVFSSFFDNNPSLPRERVELRLLQNIQGLLGANGNDLVDELFPDTIFPESGSTLRQLVREWLNKIDLYNHITDLIQQSSRGKNPIAESLIADCLTKQRRRTEILYGVQQKSWTKENLKTALRRILRQEQQHLELILFLDALDEYDGRPEFIADFLTSIVQETYPKTRVRICFSSRPWKVFINEFSQCPGFKIHEHTENDMRSYCEDIISANEDIAPPLAPLVPEIMRRAKGVFLWVRLVMFDLIKAAVNFDSQGGTKKITEELRDILKSLPNQLDEYYLTIIKRVPQNLRWDLYVLLECVVCAQYAISPDVAELALLMAESNTFQDGSDQISSSSYPEENRKLKRICAVQEPNSYGYKYKFHEVSGGLVELIRHDHDTWSVEFMHQTVREFVQDPGFKQKILGNLAKIKSENGHSFLAKAYLYRRNPVGSYHARRAEETTGRSLYSFFFTAPYSHFPTRNLETGPLVDLYPNRESHSTALDFALEHRLDLCLQDAIQSENGPDYMSNASMLAPVVCFPPGDRGGDYQQLGAVKILRENGFSPGLDDLNAMFDRKAQLGSNSLPPMHPDLERLLIDHLISELDHITGHSGRSRFIEKVLLRGGDANALDDKGHTLLDFVVRGALQHRCVNNLDPSLQIGGRGRYSVFYKIAYLLKRQGGKLRVTSTEEWEEFMKSGIAPSYKDSLIELDIFEKSRWLGSSPPDSPPPDSPPPDSSPPDSSPPDSSPPKKKGKIRALLSGSYLLRKWLR